MKIAGQKYDVSEISRNLTVPDCNVLGSNKLGSGNGEAKFYFGTKLALSEFSQDASYMECFFLKSDLLKYMEAARKEYQHPSQNYAGKNQMAQLWQERVEEIAQYPEVIEFVVEVQQQIEGPRGYLNSSDPAYKLFRKLSLPLISYISIMRLLGPGGKLKYYWKLFIDFEARYQKKTKPLVFTYGKGEGYAPEETSQPNIQGAVIKPKAQGRDSAAQAKYRARLLEECPFCPITRISDERLLIASHIKPCSESEPHEEFDPKNGFILSPLYDRLFDQGFITFDEKRRMIVSNWLSPKNQEKCRIKSGDFIQSLPLDDEREFYLKYHRQYVFRG